MNNGLEKDFEILEKLEKYLDGIEGSLTEEELLIAIADVTGQKYADVGEKYDEMIG